MKFLGTKDLESNRLLLRRFKSGDEVEVFEYAKDEEVTEFLTRFPHQNIETTKTILNRWIEEYEKPETFRWAIIYKKDNKLVGAIDVVNLIKEEDGILTLEIGYVLNREYWNKGIMSEALIMVRDYLFNECDVQKITLRCDELNIASFKVMLKAGFKDLHIKKDSFNKGKPQTLIYVALTKEEYLSSHR